MNGSGPSDRTAKWWLAGAVVLILVVLALLSAERGEGGRLPDDRGSTVEVSDGRYASAEQASLSAAADWKRWDGKDYLRSEAGRTLWVRVTLRNPGDEPADGVLADDAFYVDHVTGHLPREGGGWRTVKSGEWTASSEKVMWGRDMAFPVTVPARGERIVYLEMSDYFGVCMRPVWWRDRADFHSLVMRRTLAEGGYFGALLALLLYNAMLWVGTRFPGIGAYLLRMTCFSAAILLMRGEFPVIGLALGSPWMEAGSISLFALSGWFLLRFTRGFLPESVGSVRAKGVVDRVGRVLLLLAVAALAAPWIPGPPWLAVVMAGIACAHLVVPWIAFVSGRKDGSSPGYQLLLTGLVFGGLIPTCSVLLPLLSLEAGGFLIMGGSLAEMLLLSLMIAARHAGLQREKVVAQKRLLEEAEKRKVIQEAYVDELASEVEERTKELLVLLDDKDRMIAVLGHDLRSPLTGLTRRAEQLAQGSRPEDLERFAGDTAAMGGRLLLLIEDLVLWGRLRAGSVHFSTVRAKALVEPVLALHRVLAEQRGIAVEADVSPELELRTDVVLCQTLVRNLLSNAIKFARSKVGIRVSEVPQGVEFSVTDDGPGLPDRPFAELNRSGLGLSLCEEIGEALGTKLEAGPASGGGTFFAFVLAVSGEKRETMEA